MTNDSQVNTVPAVRTNKRKANCADCRRLLQKGEGVAQSYAMFHGTGEFYYLCPGCDRKRKESK